MGRAAIACRLTYVVSHPIQYQAPLLRLIAAEPDIELRVLFERIDENHTYFDEGFGREVSWNVPLTSGYNHAAVSECNLTEEVAATDVLWLHGWQTGTIRGLLRQALHKDVPTLMRGENNDLAMPDGRGLRGWAKRRYIDGIFAHCTAFLAIGSLNHAYYEARGVPTDRIFPMPYAVDNEAFQDAAAESLTHHAAMRRQLGIGEHEKIVLFAGKLTPRKRADLLIEAMRHVISPTPVKLLIVGDGPKRAALERNAPDAVFAGFVNQRELPAYYALADVFVLPSEREPWGLAVNEAMACGTPVVVSDEVGCAPDLVDTGSGRIFPSGDERALAEAISEVLADAENFGLRAHEKITTWSFAEDIAGLRDALGALGKLP